MPAETPHLKRRAGGNTREMADANRAGPTFGNKRFGELQRDIVDISPKMLSQELKALEENKIITRTLYDSMPVAVEYALTPLGKSMKKLLDEVLIWGEHFRKGVIGK